MKISDLRIGNYINHLPSPRNSTGNGIVKVETLRDIYINAYDCFYEDDCELRYYEPIPLTEEILLKCGFCETSWDNNSTLRIFNDDITIVYDKEYKTIDVGDIELHNSIKYIHQLQNLYFALTNEELTINI